MNDRLSAEAYKGSLRWTEKPRQENARFTPSPDHPDQKAPEEALIRVPAALRSDPMIERLVEEVDARSKLVHREKRMGRMVEAIRALQEGIEWIKGTDSYKVPGDLVERFDSILKRCEEDFRDEIVWVRRPKIQDTPSEADHSEVVR